MRQGQRQRSGDGARQPVLKHPVRSGVTRGQAAGVPRARAVVMTTESSSFAETARPVRTRGFRGHDLPCAAGGKAVRYE